MTKKGFIRKIRRLGQKYETSLRGIGPIILIGLNFRTKNHLKTYHVPSSTCSPDTCCFSADIGTHYSYDGGLLTFTISEIIQQAAGDVAYILWRDSNRWTEVRPLYNSLP